MPDEILDHLKHSILHYDTAAARRWAAQVVERDVDPLAALGALTEAIREVGEQFGRGELWLPDLVGASDALLAATPVLEAEIQRLGVTKQYRGTLVIGTVEGDIHSIGKSIVATLLTAEGFRVHDLGVDVPAATFVRAVRNYGAQILALSALMTTTAPQLRKVIEMLRAEGNGAAVKVMVGGGGITEAFAESIGADGYDPTAPGAVRLANSFLSAQADDRG
jgi:methanogenic corrinoid protein MtbC1